APTPRWMKTGAPPTALKARTGEFTPPGKRRLARSNSAADWGRLSLAMSVRLLAVVAGAAVGTAAGAWAARRVAVVVDGVLGLLVVGALVGALVVFGARLLAQVLLGQRLALGLGACGGDLGRHLVIALLLLG